MSIMTKSIFAKTIMPIAILSLGIAPSYSFANGHSHNNASPHHHASHKKSAKVPNIGKPWSNPARPKRHFNDTPVQRPISQSNDACHASQLQYLIGKNKSVLMTMKFGQVTRIGGPDTMFTMDYNPARLNILYDKSDVINSVTCG